MSAKSGAQTIAQLKAERRAMATRWARASDNLGAYMDRTNAELAAKDARIAELDAELALLRPPPGAPVQ